LKFVTLLLVIASDTLQITPQASICLQNCIFMFVTLLLVFVILLLYYFFVHFSDHTEGIHLLAALYFWFFEFVL